METTEPVTWQQVIAKIERHIVALYRQPGPAFGDGPPPPPCFDCGRHGVHTWLCAFATQRRAEL